MSGWEGLRARQRVVSSMGRRDKVVDDNGFECDECVSKGFTKEFFSYRTNKRTWRTEIEGDQCNGVKHVYARRALVPFVTLVTLTTLRLDCATAKCNTFRKFRVTEYG